MGYQILPALIFFFSIFGIIFILLKKMPNSSEQNLNEDFTEHTSSPENNLSAKGLPVLKFSKIKFYGKFYITKLWRFALEAKEMAPSGKAVLKIKKLFLAKPKLQEISQFLETDEEIMSKKNEEDFFADIKREPKNLNHYDNLGKLYLTQNKFSDAKDIFLYLTSHNSAQADYWARLGFSAFRLKDFPLATEAYKKAIALDSSKPNRYYNLALCFKAQGLIQEAQDSLQKALEIDHQNFKFLEFKKRLQNLDPF